MGLKYARARTPGEAGRLHNRCKLLEEQIRKLNSVLLTEKKLNEGMSERAQHGRMKIIDLVKLTVERLHNSSLDSDHYDQYVQSYANKIVGEIIGNMWFSHSNHSDDFQREMDAMFSQQHYTKLAELIKGERQRIEREYAAQPANVSQPEDSVLALTKDAQHHAISEMQAALIKTFESDNPKFKTFKFIEACSQHVSK